MRRALEMVWDLNIKAIPSAMLWAISLWFIIETSSLLIRITALFVADLAVLLSGAIVAKHERPMRRSSFHLSLSDPFVRKVLLPTSIILGLALQNARQQESSAVFAKYFYSSIVLSSLILWLFVSVVLIPGRAFQGFRGEEIILFATSLNLVRKNKGTLALALSILLFGWPFFFVYIFLALTLSQCLILPKIEEALQESANALEM
ncbi:MAG: hypothetical protein HY050_06145 [Actinobacteria bacterium]|nr:hypothetical protein [Actinomycetota bacterium]